jgi:hypothetical protein
MFVMSLLTPFTSHHHLISALEPTTAKQHVAYKLNLEESDIGIRLSGGKI